MIDPILGSDDKNRDGYIDYPEFVQAQQAAQASQPKASVWWCGRRQRYTWSLLATAGHNFQQLATRPQRLPLDVFLTLLNLTTISPSEWPPFPHRSCDLRRQRWRRRRSDRPHTVCCRPRGQVDDVYTYTDRNCTAGLDEFWRSSPFTAGRFTKHHGSIFKRLAIDLLLSIITDKFKPRRNLRRKTLNIVIYCAVVDNS